MKNKPAKPDEKKPSLKKHTKELKTMLKDAPEAKIRLPKRKS